MKIKDLRKELITKGFTEETRDTGFNYTKTHEHIELICYIEPDIEVEFISIFKWDNNDVKGVYNISFSDLTRNNNTLFSLFKKTIKNMPVFVGTKNIHTELEDFMIENLW